jgi:dUTP pyrophosphatase
MRVKLIDFDYFEKPKRNYNNDAGLDVYANKSVVIEPHTTVAIPLGFGLELPDGYMGVIYNRSSYSKKGLLSSNAPIDSGYRGEVHCILTNSTNNKVYINRGDRVGQLVIIPIVLATLVEDSENERQRGTNGFGSSGK